MNCTSKHELTERDLLMYLDGASSQEVNAHLEMCQNCQQRAQQMARIQSRLQARLYRLDCPDPTQLGEFHLDMLPEVEADMIAQHLESCPHCTREVSQLEMYMSTLAPTLETHSLQQIREKAKILIARLVSPSSRGGTAPRSLVEPAYVGIRGPREEPIRYEAGSVVISLEVLTDTKHPDRRMIQGVLLGPEEYGDTDVHLWQSSSHIATETVTSDGNFSLSDLDPNSYDLILVAPGEEIHIQDLQVT